MGGARPGSSDRLTTLAKGSGKRERQKPRSTQTLRANQAQREQSDGGVLSVGLSRPLRRWRCSDCAHRAANLRQLPTPPWARQPYRAPTKRPTAGWATASTGLLGAGGGQRRLGCPTDLEAVSQLNARLHLVERYRTTRRVKPEVTPLHEARRQHVRQKATDELGRRKRRLALAGTLHLSVTKHPFRLVGANDAALRDRPLEHLARAIQKTRLRVAHRLAIDIPIDRPDLGIDRLQPARRRHGVAELRPKDW